MITYKKLFHLLLDRDIKRGELASMAKIPPNTMQRLKNDQGVNTETINKICEALNCQPGDIMAYVPGEKVRSPLEKYRKMREKKQEEKQK